MEVCARLRYLRIAPRKVRLVADLIRGKKAEEAQTILHFTKKRAGLPLSKLLKSAITSALHDFRLEESNLYISKILVDEGPKLKRWRPRARGRAFEIQKKTSHITIVLEEIEKKKKKPKAVKKVKKPREEVKEKKIEKPKLKPRLEIKKPKIQREEGGLRRVFRRKAF